MRSLKDIARDIRKDWKTPYIGCTPWLMYMSNIHSNTLSTEYWGVSGRVAVTEFLNNSDSWKGEVATAIKGELRKGLKDSRN